MTDENHEQFHHPVVRPRLELGTSECKSEALALQHHDWYQNFMKRNMADDFRECFNQVSTKQFLLAASPFNNNPKHIYYNLPAGSQICFKYKSSRKILLTGCALLHIHFLQ